MREATIGGLSAMDEIRPRKATGQSPKAKAPRGKSREGRMARFRRFRSRVTLIVGSAGFSAIMIGIVLNATVMQKGHHPAPLFANAAPQVPVVPAAAIPAPPAAAALPAVVPAPGPAPRPAETPDAPQSVSPPLAAVHHAARATAPLHAAKADPIARLLGGEPQHHASSSAVSSHPKATAVALKPKAVPLASAKPGAAPAVN